MTLTLPSICCQCPFQDDVQCQPCLEGVSEGGEKGEHWHGNFICYQLGQGKVQRRKYYYSRRVGNLERGWRREKALALSAVSNVRRTEGGREQVRTVVLQ